MKEIKKKTRVCFAFQFQAQWKYPVTESQIGSFSDSSGRTTRLAPILNILHNQFVWQPFAQLWGKTVLRYF